MTLVSNPEVRSAVSTTVLSEIEPTMTVSNAVPANASVPMVVPLDRIATHIKAEQSVNALS